MSGHRGSLIPHRQPEGTPSHPAWEIPGYRKRLEKISDPAVDLLIEVLAHLKTKEYTQPIERILQRYKGETAARLLEQKNNQLVEWFLERYQNWLQKNHWTVRDCSLEDLRNFFVFVADANLYHSIDPEDAKLTAAEGQLLDQIAALVEAAGEAERLARR